MCTVHRYSMSKQSGYKWPDLTEVSQTKLQRYFLRRRHVDPQRHPLVERTRGYWLPLYMMSFNCIRGSCDN